MRQQTWTEPALTGKHRLPCGGCSLTAPQLLQSVEGRSRSWWRGALRHMWSVRMDTAVMLVRAGAPGQGCSALSGRSHSGAGRGPAFQPYRPLGWSTHGALPGRAPSPPMTPRDPCSMGLPGPWANSSGTIVTFSAKGVAGCLGPASYCIRQATLHSAAVAPLWHGSGHVPCSVLW